MACSNNRQIFTIKRHDLSPAIKIICEPRNTFDLTGAQVFFNMVDLATGQKIIDRGAGYIVPHATLPIVAYQWQPGDTDAVGEYKAEFEILYSGGIPESIPNDEDDDLIIVIGADLG